MSVETYYNYMKVLWYDPIEYTQENDYKALISDEWILVAMQ